MFNINESQTLQILATVISKIILFVTKSTIKIAPLIYVCVCVCVNIDTFIYIIWNLLLNAFCIRKHLNFTIFIYKRVHNIFMYFLCSKHTLKTQVLKFKKHKILKI